MKSLYGFFKEHKEQDDMTNLAHSLKERETIRELIMEQPKPVPNDNPHIVDLVMQDLIDRKKLGIQRYGVALQANNGRNALFDSYEEALDLCQYLRQRIEEDRYSGVTELENQVNILIKEVVDLRAKNEYLIDLNVNYEDKINSLNLTIDKIKDVVIDDEDVY